MINVQFPLCDLHYTTISMMVTDKLAQGLVCNACSTAVSHMGVFFFNITMQIVETVCLFVCFFVFTELIV